MQPLPRIAKELSGIRPESAVKKLPAFNTGLSPDIVAPAKQPTKQLVCFACGCNTAVPVNALSARCTHCAAYLNLADLVLHPNSYRTHVHSYGTVTVEPGARLQGLTVECKDLILLGQAAGNFLCHGVCKIKSDQHIRGTIRADKLVIAKRARVVCVDPVHVQNAIIDGTFEGRLYARDTVYIRHHGKLIGDIRAARRVIARNALHHGHFSLNPSPSRNQESV